jgi:hypothetical protein
MPSHGIIDTFQQRRQLEQALDEMTNAVNEMDLIEAVRQIHRTYPDEMALAALLKRLDTPDGQLRGGLARLAVLLPRADVVAALRSYAGNRNKPPLGRTTAVMILERFLKEKAPGGLVSDLQDSNDAAFQSLLDAVRQGKRNRHVLLEYVTQMQEYGEETAFHVMQNIDRLPAEESVDLLRLIAQDGRYQVASAAVTRLEALADGGETGATRALYTLLPNLNRVLATRVERGLRKQQFRGHGYTPVAPTGWRALLGVADPGGHMMVWLAHAPNETPPHGFLAGLLVHRRHGIVYDYFADGVGAPFLPAPAQVGQMTTLPGVAGAPIMALETAFDVVRWLIREALSVHAAGKAQRSLSGEYKLYSDLLWQFAPPVVVEEATALLAPVQSEELDAIAGDHLAHIVDALMAHPAMAGWVFPLQTILENDNQESWLKSLTKPDETIAMLLSMIEGEELARQLLPALSDGLQLQAIWFHMAGEKQLAKAARLLAAAVPTIPAPENPLLIAMFQRGWERTQISSANRPKKDDAYRRK